jgi:hypothetical protein
LKTDPLARYLTLREITPLVGSYSPHQYISLLAHAWECAPHEAIERIRARIRRLLTDGNPGEAR